MTAAPKSEPGSDQVVTVASRGHWFFRPVALVCWGTCGFVVLVSIQYWLGRIEESRVPEIDLSGATAAVAAAVESAVAKVRAEPEAALAWGELAMLLRAHGFDRPADVSFRRARLLDPNEFRWPYLLGVSLENVDPIEAEANLREAIRLKPNTALPRLPLAELLAEAGRSQEAESLFSGAKDLEPENVRALLGLARLRMHGGADPEALGLCDQAARLQPDDRMAQELRARLLFRLGRSREAERVRRRLEQMSQVETSDDPYVAEVILLRRDPNWIATRVETMLGQGLTDQAVAYLEKKIREYPGRSRFPLQLARALGGSGQAARAGDVIVRAIEEFPESPELRLLQGLVFGELGQSDRAEQGFRAAIERKPDYIEAWLWLGRVLRERDQVQEAEKCFGRVIAFRPDLPTGHASLGELMLATRRAAAAVLLLETALDLSPGDDLLRKRLAEARKLARDE